MIATLGKAATQTGAGMGDGGGGGGGGGGGEGVLQWGTEGEVFGHGQVLLKCQVRLTVRVSFLLFESACFRMGNSCRMISCRHHNNITTCNDVMSCHPLS